MEERTQAQEVMALLEHAEDPQSEDPGQWTPPQVLALALKYAYGVEVLPKVIQPGWDELSGLAEEILFVRDLLADWLNRFGEEALEELLAGDLNEMPLPSETDLRLEELYRDNPTVRDFLHAEYRRFRQEIAPGREARWWWLDAELYGKQVH